MAGSYYEMTLMCVVRGYHVYKDVWEVRIAHQLYLVKGMGRKLVPAFATIMQGI